MTTHNRDKIIAAAQEAGIYRLYDGLSYGPSGLRSEQLERFYAIAFEAGAASRDSEVAQWRARAIDHEVKHDVAVGTLEKVKDDRKAAQRALAEQGKHTKSIEQERDKLRAELVKALAACKVKDEEQEHKRVQ